MIDDALVLTMRNAQREYFKTRSREALIASKQAEAAVDKALADTPDVAGLEEAVRLAEVGEYLYSACAHSYGDGYTEPREYGIDWQWQQSKPGEYGQGQLLAAATRWHAGQAEDGIITEAAKLRAALTAQAARVEQLERVLAPFTKYYDLNDCHERDDDDVLEVPVRDLRAAAALASKTPASGDGFNVPEPHTPQYPFPTRRFHIGDRVRKTKGSSWQGRVVGFYSTSVTDEGYAVESEREPGSVQIYPVSALEPAPPKEGV